MPDTGQERISRRSGRRKVLALIDAGPSGPRAAPPNGRLPSGCPSGAEDHLVKIGMLEVPVPERQLLDQPHILQQRRSAWTGGFDIDAVDDGASVALVRSLAAGISLREPPPLDVQRLARPPEEHQPKLSRPSESMKPS